MTNTTTTTTLTNTEILDGLILEFENTVERLVDTKGSMQITRTVKPEDGTEKSKFKDIHNRIKDIVKTDFPKTRGSNELIETIQELKLISSNDEEEKKLSVLKHKITSVRNQYDCPYDKSILDTLFSNNALFQRVITISKYGVSSNVMNDINEFVTSLYISNTLNSRDDIRKLLIGDETSLQNDLWNRFRISKSFYSPRSQSDMLNDYETAMSWLDIDYFPPYIQDDDYTQDIDVSVEYINSFDTSILFNKLASIQDDLKELNEVITEYKKSISISVSEFLELFPLLSKVVEDRITHNNKLVRKVVKVEVTKIYEMEIDVVDEGDIETEISNIMKDRKDITTMYQTTSKGDPITEVSSKFGGVSLLEVRDFKEQTEMVA
jgi:hypothetical protein